MACGTIVVFVSLTRATSIVGADNCMVAINECLPSKKKIDAAPCLVNFDAPYLQWFWQDSLQYFTEQSLIPKNDIGTGFLMCWENHIFCHFQTRSQNDLIFNTNFFQPPPPCLRYHSNVQIDACFEQHISAVFTQKQPRIWSFCYFHEGCSKWSLLLKFGFGISLDGWLVTVFISHSFLCFNNLKLDNTITMAPRIVSFDLVLCKLSEKVTFVHFQQVEQVFGFWIGIPSQNSENYEPPLNANNSFNGNQVCVRRLIFRQTFKKIYVNRFWEG